MKKYLRMARWLSLAACVSVPHVLPVGLHWPVALGFVAIAAALDFASAA